MFFSFISDLLSSMDGQLKFELVILIIVLIIARFLYVTHKIVTGYTKWAERKRTTPCKTVIVVGSGGHTTEMITLLKVIDFEKYSPRYYIVAKSDVTSVEKIEKLEKSKGCGHFQFIKIPRSRYVGQSYITSVLTTIFSIIYSVPIVLMKWPDLVLCNGPGTCIPICLVCHLLKVAFIRDIRIVFIESYCRTQTFSLTGKILMYIADNFIVQWDSLKAKYSRSDYLGTLM